MSTNKTSWAPRKMAKGAMSHLCSRPVRVAVGEKYNKMEGAIDSARAFINDKGDKLPEAKADEYYEQAMILGEASDFDPLAND